MIRTVSRPALALVLMAPLGLGACKSEAPSPEAAKPGSSASEDKRGAAPEPASEQAKPPDLAALMRDHFTHASALEQAVIDGDLEEVDAHAQALVEKLDEQALPDSWAPHVERMQTAAKSAAGTEDLVAAASAAGEVVAACGACHAAVGGGPKFPAAPAPVPEGEDSKARMARHAWAAQRMREGMIGPSDERWRLGAGAVSGASHQVEQREEEDPHHVLSIGVSEYADPAYNLNVAHLDAEVLSAEVLQLRERIYEIGAEAAKTEGLDARAKVYGEYLTTCAGCHVGGC